MSGALLTDLYQLTMAHAYFELGMHESAVFELFVRRLPGQRNFLIAAGLEPALGYLEELRFTPEELAYLDGLGLFSARFLEHLAGLRFSGTVHALAEGTPCFAGEPLLRVTAPLLEAQLIESRLLNIVHFQTLIASKAARCVLVAGGRRLIDFGMRRAHEADAALWAARAAYLAGFDATATLEAARRFGIPASGTMAHSYIEAHDSEEQAFRHFVEVSRSPTTLLLDTYDTQRAARRVASLVQRLRAQGLAERVSAVRIDSGDLARESGAVRAVLDAHDCPAVRIVLSGGLDEYRIAQLLEERSPVDAFGVGTALDASTDAPVLDMAYKLQHYAGRPRRKRSAGKETWPGAKQVYRERDAGGVALRDALVLAEECAPGEPLLREVMRAGRTLGPAPALAAVREHCRSAVAELPDSLRTLGAAPPYAVVLSEGVRGLAAAAPRD